MTLICNCKPATYKTLVITYSDPTLYCATLRVGKSDEPRDLDIAKENIDYSNSLESFRWLSKNYLYFKLKQDSLLLSSDPAFQNEKDSLEYTNIGEFEALRDSINQLPEDSMEYLQIMELMNMANSVSTQDAIEIYLKLMNQIYLNRLSIPGTTYSSAQWNSINYVSNLCPYEYGPAVYSGRVMKAMKDSLVDYYDPCISVAPAPRFAASTTGSPVMVTVTPNPGFGQWYIRIHGGDEATKLIIEIRDALGKMIEQLSLEGKTEMEYQNENLNPGLYNCRIIHNGIVISDQKLVMMKR